MDIAIAFIVGGFLGGAGGAGLAVFVVRQIFQERIDSIADKLELETTAHATEKAELVVRHEATIGDIRRTEAQLRNTEVQSLKRELVTVHNEFKTYRAEEQRMKESFENLANRSLDSNSKKYLEMTSMKMAPLIETQKKLEAEIRALETARQSAYDQLVAKTTALSSEANRLNQMLNSPTARGSWGEFHLKRVVELAGLHEHVDFETQVAGEEGRPDVVVELPGKREIVIDSKVPMSAFNEALKIADESERAEFIERHVKAVRSRIAELSKKEYQAKFERLDFVIVFIPVEAAYYAALASDPELIEFKTKSRVLLAGPVTLIALLRAVAFSWREVGMIENAAKIGELAETMQDRFRIFADHFGDIGDRIGGLVKKYNSAAASFNSRLLPQARTLEKYVSSDAARAVMEPQTIEEAIAPVALDVEGDADGRYDD